MTKFILDSPSGGPLDYPALGFSAVDGAILDGTASTPAITSVPDGNWSVYGGASAETGINRYAPPATLPTYTEPTNGYFLTYSDTDNAGTWQDPVAAFSAADPSDSFAPVTLAGKVAPSRNGIDYDGTDESTAMQALINACATFGVGVIELEGLVRCDSQLTIPTTGATQPRQSPLRITGNVQNMPGSTFTEDTPYPKGAGLDLRYAGRTDTGCGTVVGSALVTNTSAVAADRGNIVSGPGIPDWCWIIASTPGVGWTLSKSARATGTVTLKNFGARFQTMGYGNLEVDHVQLLNRGTASSAPFLIATGTKVDFHHNLVIGHATKTGNTCDEDIVLGGPGQGTALTTALTSGNTYTTLAVTATPCPLVAGSTIILNTGTASEQTVTVPSAVAAGATSIPVSSFTAAATYPVRTSVYFKDSQDAVGAGILNVASGLFQGYGTRIHDNHFHRFRRVAQGGWASSTHVDHNCFMHNCGSTNTAVCSTLTTALVKDTSYTTLAVTATARAILSGDTVQIGSGDTSQEVVASAAVAVGATSIPVTSFTANAAYSTSTKVVGTTGGIAAAIESYAVGTSANSITVTGNRIGFSGGYNYGTLLNGGNYGAAFSGNDAQDMNHNSNVLAMHRFSRSSQFNTVIGGLVGSGVPLVDDWSSADHTPAQTVLDPGQSKPSKFPQGVILGASMVTSPTFTWSDTNGKNMVAIAGALRTWLFAGPITLAGDSSAASYAGTTILNIGNGSRVDDPALVFNGGSATTNSIQFKRANTTLWQWYDAGTSTDFYFRDMTNSKMHLSFFKGSGAGGGSTEVNSALKVVGNVGFYNTTPIAKQTLAAAATDAATTQTLANDLRTKLIALGLFA